MSTLLSIHLYTSRSSLSFQLADLLSLLIAEELKQHFQLTKEKQGSAISGVMERECRTLQENCPVGILLCELVA